MVIGAAGEEKGMGAGHAVGDGLTDLVEATAHGVVAHKPAAGAAIGAQGGDRQGREQQKGGEDALHLFPPKKRVKTRGGQATGHSTTFAGRLHAAPATAAKD